VYDDDRLSSPSPVARGLTAWEGRPTTRAHRARIPQA